MSKVPIPSHLVIEILEEENSDKITLVLKNNFSIKASKKQFKNYNEYKKAVASHNSLRPFDSK